MLQMVARGLEHVVMFVCNLPPSPTGLGHLGHVLCTETVLGEKGIGRELCARFGMEHGQRDPMDCSRLCPVLQQHIIDEARESHCRQATVPATLRTLGKGSLRLPKGQAFRELGMRVRLTHQDTVETLLESQRAKRLLAGESIAQPGHVRRDASRRMTLHPPFACGLLTVLCRLPILGHDVCGRSGDALCASRADNDRGNRRMVIQRLPIGKLTSETMGTMEGLGGKVLRPIQRDEQLMVQHAEGVSQALRLQVGKDLDKDGGAIVGGNGIEERADVIVARDRLDAAKRLRVIMALTVAELALVL